MATPYRNRQWLLLKVKNQQIELKQLKHQLNLEINAKHDTLRERRRSIVRENKVSNVYNLKKQLASCEVARSDLMDENVALTTAIRKLTATLESKTNNSNDVRSAIETIVSVHYPAMNLNPLFERASETEMCEVHRESDSPTQALLRHLHSLVRES